MEVHDVLTPTKHLEDAYLSVQVLPHLRVLLEELFPYYLHSHLLRTCLFAGRDGGIRGIVGVDVTYNVITKAPGSQCDMLGGFTVFQPRYTSPKDPFPILLPRCQT